MRILVMLFAVLLCPFGLAQQKVSTNPCPSDEQALLAIEHQRWYAAAPRHDAAATDKLLAQDFFYSDDTGKVMSRNQFLQLYKASHAVRNDTQPAQDVRIVVNDDVAIMNFTLLWKSTQSGISWSQTSRLTEVFGCRAGQWKILALHETVASNANRVPSPATDDVLDEFVGDYVITQNDQELAIKIKRQGHQMLEQWGEDKPDEILPGKHDTFFVRYDSIGEVFLRDKNDKVTGILYTMPDGELEATRIPANR